MAGYVNLEILKCLGYQGWESLSLVRRQWNVEGFKIKVFFRKDALESSMGGQWKEEILEQEI